MAQDLNQIKSCLDGVGEAFNANDIDAVMAFFAVDAIFDHAAGPDQHGKRFEGAETIRGVFQGLFDNVVSVHWETLSEAISGDRAFCQYRRVAKLKSGEVQDFLSVDILTIKDGKITHKDTYYKNRSS